MQHVVKAMKNLLCLIIVLFPIVGHTATTPTQAQIEQFKKLPATQQQALAKQFGVDLGSSQSSDSQWQQPELFNPRQNAQMQQDAADEPQSKLDKMLKALTEETEIKPFGYDVFASSPTTFAPVTDTPIPVNYILGPGDEVNLLIYGKDSQQLSLRVERDGNILLPDYGPFAVAGMTFAEAKTSLSRFIQDKAIGIEAYITLGELKTMRIFVMGDVFVPGAYSVSSLSTITNALYVAGGIKDIGSLRNIQLKRNGEVVGRFDLYDLLINGDASNDKMLQAGDVILVPSVGPQITVKGEVKRPAIYEVRPNENLTKVLDMAGGLKPSASSHDIVIERQTRAIRKLENIDLSKASDASINIEAGDIVRVSKASENFENAITIIGAVTRPGFYQWKPEIKVSDLLKDLRADLLSYADYDYSLVISEDAQNNLSVRQFDLSAAITKHDNNDLVLNPNDKILVFSRYEKKTTQYNLTDLARTESELEKQQRIEFLSALKQLQFIRQIVNPEILTGEQTQIPKAPESASSDSNKTSDNEIFYHISGLIGNLTDVEIAQMDEQKVFEHFLVSQYSRERLLTPLLRKLKEQAYNQSQVDNLKLASIIGAVRYPGEYPISQNATAEDLIAAAGGLTEKAYLNGGELSRNSMIDGVVQVSHVPINLNDILNHQRTLHLQHLDSLNVLEMPDWQSTYNIELRGEFKFPGTYSINRGETLADVITRAGGLTRYAHANGAVFTREELKIKEKENTKKVAMQLQREIATKNIGKQGATGLSYMDIKGLVNDLANAEPVGRMVIDLPSVLSGDADKNFKLEPGDVLYVPSNPGTINVYGEVQLASSHLYDKGLTVDDYLALSGGLKYQADPERIYVLKANGGVVIPNKNGYWFSSGNTIVLEPGDSIIVPIDGDYIDNLSLWSTATQILYQAAVALAAISSI